MDRRKSEQSSEPQPSTSRQAQEEVHQPSCSTSARTRPRNEGQVRRVRFRDEEEGNGRTLTDEAYQEEHEMLTQRLQQATEKKARIMEELEVIRERSRMCRESIEKLHESYAETCKQNEGILFFLGAKYLLGQDILRDAVTAIVDEDGDKGEEKMEEVVKGVKGEPKMVEGDKWEVGAEEAAAASVAAAETAAEGEKEI